MKRCLTLLAVVIAVGTTAGTAGTLAVFHTAAGELGVELFDQDKPVTVQNFLRYVEGGLYQGVFFHRCIPGFVLQGGGYAVLNPSSTDPIGPPWTNLTQVPSLGPITNEFSVGPRYSNTYGTLAMAKLGGDPNSASSQWFFNLADNSANLDNQNGGFTVFGRVLWGTNVLNEFNTLSLGHNLVNLQDVYGATNAIAGLFSDLPTYASGTAAPPYTSLVYLSVAVTTVTVQRQTNGARLIAWKGFAGPTNIVEVSTNLVSWQPLVSTNGVDQPMSVTDTSPPQPRQYYRVRFR